MGSFYFQGPLPPDSQLFVGRHEEIQRIKDLCLGPMRSYVIVAGSRQTGKTSLLYRVQRQLLPQPSVLLNLRMISGALPHRLFGFMATELVKQLGIPSLMAAAEQTTSAVRFERLLCELPGRIGRVTILIDELGAIPGKTLGYLANVLRAVFHDRHVPGRESLGRFVFVLAGGHELVSLSSTVVSPFSSIATKVVLKDLTLSEVKQLVAHGLSGTQHRLCYVHELAESVYEQTRGHPALTQRMAAHADDLYSESSPGSLPPLDGVRETMLREDENLQYIGGLLRDPALLDAAYRSVRSPSPFRSMGARQERLYLMGIVRDQHGVAVPRNPLYEEVIRRLAHSAGLTTAPGLSYGPAPTVSVSLLTGIVPTAFCRNLTASEFPLVTVTIDNEQLSQPAQLYVRACIEGFSDEAVASFVVPPRERVEQTLLPSLQLEPTMTLTEIRAATLRVTVRQFGSGDERLVFDRTFPIQLHAYDTALLGVDAPDGNIVDLTDHLCAFVTPHVDNVENLLRAAANHHALGLICGYRNTDNAIDRRSVALEQVEAIYTALKHDAGLAYVNSPLNFGKQEGQITQRVRLPAASLNDDQSRANCIDGTVLYASLLELANLSPIIVIVPGHAFVGWRVWEGVDEYDFLETTMTRSHDFREAVQDGRQQYEHALLSKYFERELFHPSGFARLVDVAECRSRQIYPLM